MQRFSLLLIGCGHTSSSFTGQQPIIDLHRHTPWPGDADSTALAVIQETLRAHNVVSTMLFITGREDVVSYGGDQNSRILLSPMFPCPQLTAQRKWCSVDTEGPMPDADWLNEQLAAGDLSGIGELTFNYAGISPNDPAMAKYWMLAARYDVPAFVHIGRGPGLGQGPRRHEGCCPQYEADFGNPSLLRLLLKRHPRMRVVLQHAGFDYMDETLFLLRDFPNVFIDMSVLNSIGPQPLHDASLRTFVKAGFADRIVLGSDDIDYPPIIERIDGAAFLTPVQRRGIYYDNAARFLRLDPQTIARDYSR